MSSDTPHSRRQSQTASFVAGVVSLLVITTSGIVTATALTTEDASAECRREELTLTVAVEAYIASTDHAPDSQAQLVEAGFIRAPSTLFDIDGDVVVPARGSPCIATLPLAAQPDTDGTLPEGAAPSSSVAAPKPSPCANVDSAFQQLEAVDGESAKQLSTDLHAIATSLRGSAASAQGESLRFDVDALANLLSGMATIAGLLHDGGLTADRETRTTIATLTQAIAGYLHVVHTSEIMSTAWPELARTCGTGFVPAPELVSAIAAMQEALGAFLATTLGGSPEFSTLAEMSERMATMDDAAEPRSSLVDEFDQCRADAGAATLGDNEGCDALYRACGDGDMLACNDLFNASFPGSNYSASGATCGGRTQPGGRGYAGYCEEIEEP